MGKDLATIRSHVGLSGKVFKRIVAGSDGRVLWQAGANVTYVTDVGQSYIEEVDSGASCLSPSRGNPTKDGWTFVGWRKDGQASGTVETSVIMGSDPIVLYAVYKQDVTVTFHYLTDAGALATTPKTGTRYFNASGNTLNASVTAPSGATANNWTWRGWSGNGVTAANADVAYLSGQVIPEVAADCAFYGLYNMAITASFNGNGATGGSVSAITKTRYYNSANNYSDPSFTLPANGFTRTNSTFLDWALGSVGGARYAAGSSIQLEADATFYAKWRVSVPISASVGNTNFVVRPYEGTRTLTPITLSPKYGGVITGAVTYTATGGLWTGDGFPAAPTLYVTSNPSGLSTAVAAGWNRDPADISASMNVSNAASVSIIWSLTGDDNENEDEALSYGFQYSSQTLSGTEVYEV